MKRGTFLLLSAMVAIAVADAAFAQEATASEADLAKQAQNPLGPGPSYSSVTVRGRLENAPRFVTTCGTRTLTIQSLSLEPLRLTNIRGID